MPERRRHGQADVGRAVIHANVPIGDSGFAARSRVSLLPEGLRWAIEREPDLDCRLADNGAGGLLARLARRAVGLPDPMKTSLFTRKKLPVPGGSGELGASH